MKIFCFRGRPLRSASFQKEALLFFFEKKNQKTSIRLSCLVETIGEHIHQVLPSTSRRVGFSSLSLFYISALSGVFKQL